MKVASINRNPRTTFYKWIESTYYQSVRLAYHNVVVISSYYVKTICKRCGKYEGYLNRIKNSKSETICKSMIVGIAKPRLSTCNILSKACH
ncbi:MULTISPECIES: hypothetical protein [Cysteiniphilum]|uniref:Uncharacterized protein n=1 Tax=Cysteiniphilum litorale TaxID=2056700 RepID=A0A8J3E8B8_9GAMM|nr:MULTISPECIES: hypothetical protein [Cysteiniphilum]GGF92656.1 hypothetical protein GCM10010995_07260 [Cysteiniphilum litorale]